MSGRTLLGTPPALLSSSLLLGGGGLTPPAAERSCWGGVPTPPGQQQSALDPAPASRRPPSRPLGSCLSGTLEAVVFTAPSSPIHLRAVECWRFTKDL